jgi:hypothetical protein
MSRAFVKEDHEPPRRTGRYELPPAGDAGFRMAAGPLLLEAARVSEIDDAEKATGLRWGDPAFSAEVRALLEGAIASGDDRLEMVATRYLRQWPLRDVACSGLREVGCSSTRGRRALVRRVHQPLGQTRARVGRLRSGRVT